MHSTEGMGLVLVADDRVGSVWRLSARRAQPASTDRNSNKPLARVASQGGYYATDYRYGVAIKYSRESYANHGCVCVEAGWPVPLKKGEPGRRNDCRPLVAGQWSPLFGNGFVVWRLRS